VEKLGVRRANPASRACMSYTWGTMLLVRDEAKIEAAR